MHESLEQDLKAALETRATHSGGTTPRTGIAAEVSLRRRRRTAGRLSAVAAVAVVAITGGVLLANGAADRENVQVVAQPTVTDSATATAAPTLAPLPAQVNSWRDIPAIVKLAPTVQEAVDVQYAEELVWAQCMRKENFTISRVEPSQRIRLVQHAWSAFYSMGFGNIGAATTLAELDAARPLPVPNKNWSGATEHPDVENLSAAEKKRWYQVETGDPNNRVEYRGGSSPGDGCLAAKYQATFANVDQFAMYNTYETMVVEGMSKHFDSAELPESLKVASDNATACRKKTGSHRTLDDIANWDGNPATEAAAEQRIYAAEKHRIQCEQQENFAAKYFQFTGPKWQAGYLAVQADAEKLVALKNARVAKARQVIAELAPLEPAN